MESTEPVRVAVNIRPLTTLEKGCTNCITVEPNEPKVHIGSHTFTYDFVFGNSGLPSSSIYEYCVAPLVEALFSGYNATVLAYGQTASGKTYTMGTNHNRDETNGGIIPKVMDDVFNRVEAIKDLTKCHIGVSYIQIYNEEVFDLLASNPSRAPLLIKQTASGEITLQGYTEAEVKTKEEMRSYLARGSFSRATGITNMNRQSSRSHAILTVSLKISRAKDIMCAKIHLVDLAGSEGANRTGADGMRLKEGIHINKGLLALGNVISTLGVERRRKKGGYVPYRDSKLTRLLQDSLGGNSKTVMIACVNPSIKFFEETLNTLRYANRARNIQNKAVVQKPESQVVDNLSGDVDDLNHVSNGSSDSRSQLRPSAPVFDDGVMFKERTPQKSASQLLYDKHVYNEKDVFKAFSELKIPLTSQSARFDDDSPSISSPSKPRVPVFDKPVYDDDVFEAIPELKIWSTSQSARYDDVSPSISSSSKPRIPVYDTPVYDDDDDMLEDISELKIPSTSQSTRFDDVSPSISSPSIPVYDKPVYDENVFEVIPELKIPSTSKSARFDDVFPSISSPSKHNKQNSSPFKKTESEREETVEVIDLTADASPVFIPVYDEPEREKKGPNKAVKVIDLTSDEESPQENKKLKELEKRLEAMEAKIQGNYKEKVHELEKEKRPLQSEELRQKCASTSSTTSSCNCTKRSTCKTVRCECIVSNRFCSSSCGCSSVKCSNRNRDGKLL